MEKNKSTATEILNLISSAASLTAAILAVLSAIFSTEDTTKLAFWSIGIVAFICFFIALLKASKRTKLITACVAIICILFCVVLQLHRETSSETVKIGDSIYLGSYKQQDNNPEPIEWIVLEKDGSKVFLISKIALDSKLYNEAYTPITWEECSLRHWLNNDFYNIAFDENEKKQIQEVTVVTEDYDGVDAGENTIDKVYVLSYEELNKYFETDQDRLCKPTKYVKKYAYVNPETGGCWWLLRTPGPDNTLVLSVNSDGSIDSNGGKVNSPRGTVRPVMWIEMK